MSVIRLSQSHFVPADALRAFEETIDGAGAVVSFAGYVRPKVGPDKVKALHLQAYSPMTENGIKAAIETAQTRWPLIATSIIHRIGQIKPHEPIVFVACASAHRRAAFEAADFLMDYLKTRAIFWKQEVTDRQTRWIEPRAEDYQDVARWSHKE